MCLFPRGFPSKILCVSHLSVRSTRVVHPTLLVLDLVQIMKLIAV